MPCIWSFNKAPDNRVFSITETHEWHMDDTDLAKI